MVWKSELKYLAAIVVGFLVLFWLPDSWVGVMGIASAPLGLAKWYAREHVLLCLVPAFFIAGAIGIFISKNSVMKYLGSEANKALAYGVASVSGAILAVCSCTVLPLFAGIYRMGAGIGPATAFLYSGPAINVLAIIITARVLGFELGIARAIGAISFSVIIGLLMHFIYRHEEVAKADIELATGDDDSHKSLFRNGLFFFVMVGLLVFANWSIPSDWFWRWPITGFFAAGLGVILFFWFSVKWWKIALVGVVIAALIIILPSAGFGVLVPFAAGIIGLSAILATDKGEGGDWLAASWGFAKQILPLLLLGVLLAGFLFGGEGSDGIIPSKYVEMLVGDSPDLMLEIASCQGGVLDSCIRKIWPVWTNFFASVFGAFMYFATLTEVPILKGLMNAGMGKGPALSLLLSGPALSLPNMLVIRSIMGTRKTLVFISLVITMSTIAGIIYGTFF